MKGIIIFSAGIVIGFCLACYAMDEQPSYAFNRLVDEFNN